MQRKDREQEPYSSHLLIDGSGRFTTGDIREESLELLFRLYRASQDALQRAIETGSGVMRFGTNFTNPAELRFRLNSSDLLTYPTRRTWGRRESRVGGFLNQLHLPTLSSDEPGRVLNSDTNSDLTYRYKDIIAFWDYMGQRSALLLQQGEEGTIGALKLAKSAHVDSVVANVALTTGVYKGSLWREV